MLIHYIDDDRNDMLLMQRLAKGDRDIDLTTSSSINDLSDRILSHPVDCVLLDVSRPEAVSIQDDVNRIRRYSGAPIVFITGGEAGAIRTDAINAGAEGVLEKSAVSPNVIKQIFYNAQARQSPDFGAGDATENTELPNAGMERLLPTLNYLEFGLETLKNIMTDMGRDVSAGFVAHLFESIRAMKAYASSDLATEARTPIHELIQRQYAHFSDLARTKQVNVAFGTEAAWYTQVGPSALAQSGVQHLLEGILRACSENGKLAVRIENETTGIAVQIDCDHEIIPDTSAFFGLWPEDNQTGLDARSSLMLAGLLLNLRREQIKLHTIRNSQRIIVHL